MWFRMYFVMLFLVWISIFSGVLLFSFRLEVCWMLCGRCFRCVEWEWVFRVVCILCSFECRYLGNRVSEV